MLVYIDIRYFRKPDEHQLMQERDVTTLQLTPGLIENTQAKEIRTTADIFDVFYNFKVKQSDLSSNVFTFMLVLTQEKLFVLQV